MTRRVLVTGLLLAVAQGAAAQRPPSIMQPKQAAQRAVDATNRQVVANSTLPADSAGKRAAPAPAPGRAPATGGATATDSAAGSAAVSAAPAKGSEAAFERETFAYERGGRRDPFVSLMSTSELRPLVSDLKVVGITYDASGRNSIAVLRDLGTKEQYRVRIGHTLGRMRVSSITPRTVVFTIEEFGYSRQEMLALGDSNKERKQ
jgi:hypothetical protein